MVAAGGWSESLHLDRLGWSESPQGWCDLRHPLGGDTSSLPSQTPQAAAATGHAGTGHCPAAKHPITSGLVRPLVVVTSPR